MKPHRNSIAALMAVVAMCGLGLAALHGPTKTWVVTIWTLTLVLVLGAAIGAFARRGRERFAWVGFAVFGIFGLGPEQMFNMPKEVLLVYGLSLVVEDTFPTDPVPALPLAFLEQGYQNDIRRLLGALAFAALGAGVGTLVFRAHGPDRAARPDQVHLPPDLSS